MDAKLQVAILRSSDEQLEELVRVIDNYRAHIVPNDDLARTRLLWLRDQVAAELLYRSTIDDRGCDTGDGPAGDARP
jgi:type III secretory pathway component EscU